MINKLPFWMKYNRLTRWIRSSLKLGKYQTAWGFNPYEYAVILNKVGKKNIVNVWFEKTIRTKDTYEEASITAIYFDPWPDVEDYWFDDD